jgi:hypothetical protein
MNECGPNKHRENRSPPRVTTGTAPKEEPRVDHQSEEFLARALKAEKESKEYAREAAAARQHLKDANRNKDEAIDALQRAFGMLSDVLTAYGLNNYSIHQQNSGVLVKTGDGEDDVLDWDAFVEALEGIKEKADYVASRKAALPDPDAEKENLLGPAGEAIEYLSALLSAHGETGFFLRMTDMRLVLRDRREQELDLKELIYKYLVPAVSRDRARRVELEQRGEPDLLTPLGVSRQLLEFRGHLEHLDRRVQALEDKLKE